MKQLGKNLEKSRLVKHSILNSKLAVIWLLAIIAGLFLSAFFLFSNFSAGEEFSEQKAALQMKNACAGKLDCYKEEFRKLAEVKSFEETQGTLLALQKIDLATAGDCHIIAHVIARVETDKDFSKWKELLNDQDPQLCSGGFIHGIVEEYMHKVSKGQIDNKLISEVCGAVRAVLGEWNCLHILGHLILLQETDNVPAALAICDTVPVKREAYYCYIGVFMEHNTKLNLINHGIIKTYKLTEKDAIDTEKLCMGLQAEESAVACWSEMSRVYLTIFHNDAQKAINACDKAPRDIYRQNCKKFISAFWLFTGNDRVANMKKACSYFKELDIEWKNCISVTTSVLIDSSIEYAPDVIKYCGDINYQFRESCFMVVGAKLSEKLDLQKREEICRLVAAEFKSACTLHY